MKSSRASGGASGGALTLDDLRGSGKAPDRRSEPRIPHERHIDVLPCASPQAWQFMQVTLYDCSRHGIGIISNQPFKRGDEFLTRLTVRRPTMVLYQVRHCETLA